MHKPVYRKLMRICQWKANEDYGMRRGEERNQEQDQSSKRVRRKRGHQSIASIENQMVQGPSRELLESKSGTSQDQSPRLSESKQTRSDASNESVNSLVCEFQLFAQQNIRETVAEIDAQVEEKCYRFFQKRYVVNYAFKLGAGKFGVVYSATCLDTKNTVAIKFIPKTDEFFIFVRQMVAHEFGMLRSLSSSFILSCYGVYDTGDAVAIVTEKMEMDLNQLLDRTPVIDKILRVIFLQIVLALDYLHMRDIVHADIKPENVLLRDALSELPRAKLCDFGVSTFVAPDRPSMKRVGTLDYMAPETNAAQGFNTSADMWSYGVLLYASISNLFPFSPELIEKGLMENDVDAANLFDRNKWLCQDPRASMLIKGLLVIEPENRLSARECLKHEFFGNDCKLAEMLTELKAVCTEEDEYACEIALENARRWFEDEDEEEEEEDEDESEDEELDEQEEEELGNDDYGQMNSFEPDSGEEADHEEDEYDEDRHLDPYQENRCPSKHRLQNIWNLQEKQPKSNRYDEWVQLKIPFF